MTAFCGLGEWRGTAEVYGGDGRFLGNAVDQRHARQELEDGRLRIDLSFVGPFKFSGHYVIHDQGSHRVYQGPANLGLAEAIGDRLVDADHYWPDVGLSQRLFLMVLPDENKQLSLALLSRGERLCYVVVGENDKVSACAVDGSHAPPAFVAGASCDLGADAAAGRGEVLLHRPGRWHGTLQTHDGALAATGELGYEETVRREGDVVIAGHRGGAFAPEPTEVRLRSDGWWAHSERGPLVGSYSLAGGRALSGTFQRVDRGLRVWRREVASHDGRVKAVVHVLYRGGVRLGVQHGLLQFEAAEVSGRFDGAWRVREYVYDDGGALVGCVRQRRLLEPAGERIRVVQECRPDRALDGHALARFRGRHTFELSRDGDNRVYHGPDVIGGGLSIGDGCLVARGVWPALGLNFTSWSALVQPERQLTGGTFARADAPVARIVGVATREPEDGAGSDVWPALDGPTWPGDVASEWSGSATRSGGATTGARRVYRRLRYDEQVGGAESWQAYVPDGEGWRVDGAFWGAPVVGRARSYGWARLTEAVAGDSAFEQLEALDAVGGHLVVFRRRHRGLQLSDVEVLRLRPHHVHEEKNERA